jgi:hypothetical protein
LFVFLESKAKGVLEASSLYCIIDRGEGCKFLALTSAHAKEGADRGVKVEEDGGLMVERFENVA